MDKEAPKAVAASSINCEGMYPYIFRAARLTVAALITVFEDSSREVSCPQMGRGSLAKGDCLNGRTVDINPVACTHLSPIKRHST